MEKTCRNQWCRQPFTMTDADSQFYEKISPTFGEIRESIPPPTLCPDCRLVRRMLWRNERWLYRRTCDFTQKSILSVYPAGTPFPVIERSEWYGDGWDATSFGRAYDENMPMFAQIESLLHAVPRSALNGKNVENCDYCNFIFDSKRCYLTQCGYYSEDQLYCYWSLNCNDCTDCAYLFRCERCYECTDCNHSYGCIGCTLCHTCTECRDCYDCRGCTSCYGCVGLRQKKYCFLNEQLTQAAYEEKLKKLLEGTEDDQKETDAHLKKLKQEHAHQGSIQEKNENCTGDYVYESKNCFEAFQAFRSEDCRYLQDADEMHDSQDAYHAGWSTLLYELYSPVRLQSSAFCAQCWDGANLLYCDTCQSCSNCIACVGLNHKQYCILNQQYTKAEYERLAPKIIAKMRDDGEWGEFFPITMSPFAYNETTAHVYYPLTKQEALERGFRWSDYETPVPTAEKLIRGSELPNSIDAVPDDILNWAIECDVTTKPFRLVKQELEFYRKMQVRVPRLHPDERHRRRMALRNPRKLWSRTCAKCEKPIETTYAPDRPETVCCEECYLKTVY